MDGKEVARNSIEHTTPITFPEDETFDIGQDTRTGVALILVDVRNLPEINATLGHHVGDEALNEVARRLRQNIGGSDFVARLSAHQWLRGVVRVESASTRGA